MLKIRRTVLSLTWRPLCIPVRWHLHIETVPCGLFSLSLYYYHRCLKAATGDKFDNFRDCQWRQNLSHCQSFFFHFLQWFLTQVSAAVGRWMTSDPAELPILPGRKKSCALSPMNIILKFPEQNHQFLSDTSSKSSTFMCSICRIIKRYMYQIFFDNFVNKKVTNRLQNDKRWQRLIDAECYAWLWSSCG